MLFNNYITLLIIRKKDKRIKLYLAYVWLLIALFLSFLGFTAFIYYQYYENSSRNSSYQESQNNFLEQTVYYKEVQSKLDDYSRELEKIGEFDKKIRNIANQHRTSRKRKVESFEIVDNSNFYGSQDTELQGKIGVQEKNIISQVKNIELNYRLRHLACLNLRILLDFILSPVYFDNKSFQVF